jgi:Xaa-Pro aminopeptidase
VGRFTKKSGFFTASGYPTEIRNGRGRASSMARVTDWGSRFMRAALRVSDVSSGQVFTVEPGIYLPGTGGVRHEDVVVIAKEGYQLLSNFPKQLEI